MIEGLTANEGPALLFGIADGELTDAEISEALSVGGPLDRSDNVRNERSHRPIWIIGTRKLDNEIAAQVEAQFVGEMGGPLMVGKPRWTFSNPTGWTYFVFNYDNSTLTTGASVRCHIKSFGVWVT